GRPVSQLAVDPDAPATLLDDAVDGGQAESGSLSLILGREEGLEDAASSLGIHAGPCIAHREHHVWPRAHRAVSLDVLDIEIDVGGLDGKLSAMGHGITRIHGEVHDHLLELARICHYTTQLVGQVDFDVDVFLQQATKHALDPPDDL